MDNVFYIVFLFRTLCSFFFVSLKFKPKYNLCQGALPWIVCCGWDKYGSSMKMNLLSFCVEVTCLVWCFMMMISWFLHFVAFPLWVIGTSDIASWAMEPLRSYLRMHPVFEGALICLFPFYIQTGHITMGYLSFFVYPFRTVQSVWHFIAIFLSSSFSGRYIDYNSLISLSVL